MGPATIMLPAAASAVSPAKFILFGEHAVVYGEPAIAMSIELLLKVTISKGTLFTVDSEPLDQRSHPFIKEALAQAWKGGPVDLRIDSHVPRASGLGSSAALVVATISALERLGGAAMLNEEALARMAFEVEYAAQGKASPTDTSVCTHGKAIMLAKDKHEKLLWHIKKGTTEWFIHHLDTPELTFVVGNTRQRSVTKEMVGKVKRYFDKSQLARETIKEIGTITADGAKALQKGDRVELGRLMDLNHKRLVSLGVSSPGLDKLVNACKPHSYGAKLTGKGGGGCMIALTDKPKETVEAIKRAGGEPYIVKPSMKGVRFVD